MTKVAIPVTNGQLSRDFGSTNKFNIYKTENCSIAEEDVMILPSDESDVYPKRLAEMGVTDVIVQSIGQNAIALFNQNKVHVFVGVPVKIPRELVMELLNGTLETNDITCSK